MICCGKPIIIAYRSHFSAYGRDRSFVRIQCNVCGKHTRWCESEEDALIDWRRKNE